MDEDTRRYTVTGMTCAHCAAVEVSVDAGTVLVRGSGVSDDAVRAAVDEAGYTVA